jgi:hypothetical protein
MCLQSEAAEVMKALVWAIRDNYTSHRIIITCRYDFEFTQLQHFHKQPLDALQGADLQKSLIASQPLVLNLRWMRR